MFDVQTQLGVQSWCFRNFKSPAALIEQVKAIGLSRVELCAVHADFNNESSFESTIAQFKSAGVQITSIGVQTFSGNEKTEENWFKFCQLAGAKMISATFDVSKMPSHRMNSGTHAMEGIARSACMVGSSRRRANGQ